MANAAIFQKLMKDPKVMKLAESMFNSMGQEGQANFLARPEFSIPSGVEGVGNISPLNIGAALGEQGGINAGQMGSLALGAAKAHPFKTAGLLASGLGNVGGLTDNDKFGAQLGGLALGGLGSYMLGLDPYAAAMMTMGGGNLGSLFDKLRAKKEAEQAQLTQGQQMIPQLPQGFGS